MICFVETYIQPIAEVTDLTPSVLRLNLPQPNSGGVEMSPVRVQMMMMVIRVERGVDRGNCLSWVTIMNLMHNNAIFNATFTKKIALLQRKFLWKFQNCNIVAQFFMYTITCLFIEIHCKALSCFSSYVIETSTSGVQVLSMI